VEEEASMQSNAAPAAVRTQLLDAPMRVLSHLARSAHHVLRYADDEALERHVKGRLLACIHASGKSITAVNPCTASTGCSCKQTLLQYSRIAQPWQRCSCRQMQ
jgi:hypothetical protein